MTDNQIILQVKLPLLPRSSCPGSGWRSVRHRLGDACFVYRSRWFRGLIFNGLNVYDQEMIIWGTLPVTLLALLVDFLLGKLERFVSPQTTSAKGGN